MNGCRTSVFSELHFVASDDLLCVWRRRTRRNGTRFSSECSRTKEEWRHHRTLGPLLNICKGDIAIVCHQRMTHLRSADRQYGQRGRLIVTRLQRGSHCNINYRRMNYEAGNLSIMQYQKQKKKQKSKAKCAFHRKPDPRNGRNPRRGVSCWLNNGSIKSRTWLNHRHNDFT